MSVYVGCDLGTMGSKAAVIDERGNVLGEAYEEVALHRPRAGWVEQDPLDIEASAHRVIHAAVTASGRAADIRAVAFSGQMSGIGTVGRAFEPATHYDSWLDTRCEPYINAMTPTADRVVELSGCPPTYSHGPKILWWRAERPAEYARIEKFLPIASFVAGRAVGLDTPDAFMDRTYLHFTNLADTRAGSWSAELLDTFDVDAERLPRLVESTDVIGEITPAVSARTGLPVGTPVAAGAGDTAASALGAGLVRSGRAFDAAGTASVLAMYAAEFRPDLAAGTLMAARGVAPGTYLNLAFINGGGLALRWFRDEVAMLTDLSDAYPTLDELAATVTPGADGLLWFPHLQGKVLPPRPHARGSWIGLTSGHRRAHLYRSMLEGISFEYAEWVRLARSAGAGALDEARAVGGGARSRLWNQIKADVLGIDWVVMQNQECGVLGDAMIAAVAAGDRDDLACVADEWQVAAGRVEPDPARHARYTEIRAVHRTLGETLAPVFEAMSTTFADDRPGGG